jgi:hypothetical protein
MSESKSFASLNPSLLARKGGAKPAMRPQFTTLNTDPDDLGWNDHGEEEPHHTAEIVQFSPESAANDVPEVVRQQRAIARRISRERRSALADGRRAAFTLRVDADRHLKLRLACTVRNQSAQQLVTEALDRLFADLPDLTALADQLAGQRDKH